MQYTDLEQQRKYVVEKLQEQPDPEHLNSERYQVFRLLIS